MEGFVYVMSNELMPGVLKVGYTTRTPDARALEMSSHEAVPVRMKVEYYAFVDTAVSEIESRTHRQLQAFSVAKEWFRCDVPTAILAVRQSCESRLRHEKVHYVDPAELRRREEREARERQASEAQARADNQRTETKRRAKEAAISKLQAEFARLEPVARAIYFRGIGLRVVGEILNNWLNPVQWVKDALEIRPKIDPEEQRIAALPTPELLQMIQYYQCGRLLREYAQRPTRPSFLDRLWNGEYFEVPAIVVSEFKKRQDLASNKNIFNTALYIDEWNALSS